MVGSIYKTVISLQGKITIPLSILAYLVLSALLFLVLHFKLALAEPIVILEYRGSEAINESEAVCIPSGWTLIILHIIKLGRMKH